jgi:hypothetical protein
MAELEKMRHGLVAQDYGTQMDQLGNLISTGQGAGANAATVQGQYRDAAADYRKDATVANIGLRDNATDLITDARNTATSGSNALRGFYGERMAGVNDKFADRMTGADTNYANAYTNAVDAAGNRNILNNENLATRVIGNRNNRIDQYLGGSRISQPLATQSIINSGTAMNNALSSASNAYGQAQYNNAYNQSLQNPGGTYAAPQQKPWLEALTR